MREFCRLAFAHVGLNYEDHVAVDPAFLRPAEVEVLHGNAGKARQKLGWVPETSLEAMISEIVEADMARHRARLCRAPHVFPDLIVQVSRWPGMHLSG